MNDEVAIKVQNVSKKYCKSLKRSMLYGVKDIGRNILGMSSHSKNLRKDEFWALDGVSFEVEKGETLGIIGPNGSGKTTLLRLLNGIFWPDKGKVTIKGRVGALIEVGAGFHPLLTGRENIYINAAILGMTKKEVDEKLDSIVEFADIGDFIDTPVKYYSSGMFVRLGFAVAVHCNPDILLVDEVLAVGDINFRTKCYQKIREIRDSGKSIVFVSHEMLSVAALCERTVLLLKGRLEFDGETEHAIQMYEKNAFEKETVGEISSFHEKGTREIEIVSVSLWNGKAEKKTVFKMGEKMRIRLEFIACREIDSPVFAFEIFSSDGTTCFGADMKMDNIKMGKVKKGGIIEIEYEALNLQRGKYNLLVGVYDNKALVPYDVHKKEAHYFFVESPKRYHGTLFIPHQWRIISQT